MNERETFAYRYETHLHTSPVSACAREGVRDNLIFYRDMGFDGVFITNHFLNGNMSRRNEALSYAEKLDHYFSDYEEGCRLGEELGLRVFLGVEMSDKGTDFLIFGLPPTWYYAHPEIMDMGIKDVLALCAAGGALVVQAHPFREARYIDHIRLYPRSVHAVETVNACRTDFENRLAGQYAENYGLFVTAGTDNHAGNAAKKLAGMASRTPIRSEEEFAELVKSGELRIFEMPCE